MEEMPRVENLDIVNAAFPLLVRADLQAARFSGPARKQNLNSLAATRLLPSQPGR